MTCREFIEFLMDYMSGDLTPEQKAVFDGHLDECPSCVAYMQNYRQTIAAEKAAMLSLDDPVPDAVPEELVKAILAARGRR